MESLITNPFSRFLIWMRRHQVKRIEKNGKVFYRYKGDLYSEYLNKGNASSFILDKAKHYCQGKGIDIGADIWPLSGAIPITNEEGQNAYKLDNFPDGNLDYIFSSHCLEHLDKWKDALRLWIRKLKIEGVLFLYLPHKSMRLWNPGGPWVGSGHKWIPTCEVINRFLVDNGMKIIDYNREMDKCWSFHIVAKKVPVKIEGACDICGEAKTKTLFPVIDRSYAVTYTRRSLGKVIEMPEFKVVKCKSCGHVYIKPVPNESFLDAFYTCYLDREFDADFYKDHFRTDYEDFGFGRKMEARCKKIKRILPKKSSLELCDVGSGTGIFLYIAKKHNFSARGVEINRELVNYAKEKFSVDVFCGRLEETRYLSESFDVVTLWDVVEHLTKPSILLREINRILRKGGLVAIETPDVDSLVHRLARLCYYASLKKWTKPINIYNIHHLHYFSPLTLTGYLLSNGFRIHSIDKDETNLFQCLGKDRNNVIKRDLTLNLGLRFIFLLARLLRMQNKMVVYAIKD